MSNEIQAKQEMPTANSAVYGQEKGLAAWLVNKLYLRDNEYFKIIRQSVSISVPLLFIAAIILLITLLPVEAYQRFLTETFGADWRSPLQTIFHSILAIICLAIPLSLTANFINFHNNKFIWAFVPVPLGLITIFVSNLIMIVPRHTGSTLSLELEGLTGLFSALFVSMFGCWVFLRLCRIPSLRLNLYAESAEPTISHVFSCFLPSLITVALFALLRLGLIAAQVDSLTSILQLVLQLPFLYIQSSLLFATVYTVVSQICWFFGLHGPEVLTQLTQGFFDSSAALNSLSTSNAGTAPLVFTKSILDTFVHIGGSGATLGLIIALLMSKPEADTKKVAIVAAIFDMFNINELVIFGLPIIFNPIFLIPFIFAPLLLIATSALSFYFGLVPQPIFFAEWTTPPLINAYITTNSWSALVLQLFNIALACAVYLPFVRLSNRLKVKNRQENLQKLTQIAKSPTYHPRLHPCFNSSSSSLARFLASHLEQDLYRKSSNIGLLFQPRVNIMEQSVPSVEALLRWKNSVYNNIPPVLAMALALEGNFSRKLDNYVLDLVLQQQYRWRNQGIETKIAMNLSHNQLEDYAFVDYLQAQLHNYQLPANCLSLEIKERTALGSESIQRSSIEALKATGVDITIDDFGKGYQPVIYLHTLPVSGVQISRELVRDIASNQTHKELVSTINQMCDDLGIQISVEFVESAAQLEALRDLNFSTFQGYYFAKPMTAEECAKFIDGIKSNTKIWQV